MEISKAIKYLKKKLKFKIHRLDVLTIISGSHIEGIVVKIYKQGMPILFTKDELVFKRVYMDRINDVKDLDLIIDDVKYRFSIYNSWID